MDLHPRKFCGFLSRDTAKELAKLHIKKHLLLYVQIQRRPVRLKSSRSPHSPSFSHSLSLSPSTNWLLVLTVKPNTSTTPREDARNRHLVCRTRISAVCCSSRARKPPSRSYCAIFGAECSLNAPFRTPFRSPPPGYAARLAIALWKSSGDEESGGDGHQIRRWMHTPPPSSNSASGELPPSPHSSALSLALQRAPKYPRSHGDSYYHLTGSKFPHSHGVLCYHLSLG